jgi:hypothetical protein
VPGLDGSADSCGVDRRNRLDELTVTN